MITIAESKADLILHPVRVRIVQALVGGRQMSAQQLAEILTDVPPATLYRHLSKLAKAGVLEVVDQRQVRGTVEKTYALSSGVALTPEDLDKATREDHLRWFLSFTTALVSDFGRYLEKPEIDMLKDGVGYRSYPLHLSDEEFQEFLAKLRAVLLEATGKTPAPGRRRRVISTVMIPDPTDHQT